MEKRTVRIYKAPDGKGRYINKTSQFLHKAEEGAQVDNGMDQYVQYIQSELQNQTDPQEIYQNLVEAGLPEENAQSLIQQIMQGMPQSEETEPAQYRDGGEQEVLDQYAAMTDQGQEDPQSYNIDEMIENTPGTQTFQFPGLDQYIPSYNPIGWDESNVDAYGNATFERGGTKKSFAKNVLAYLKKQQEGGEGDAAEVDPNQPLGRGNLQDTDTDTISKRKSDFLATLKNQADTAKTEELHGKMMQSGDPSLMQIANTLGQGEKAQPIPFAPVAQTGGFTGGADPMDYFQDGGYDEQYAQDGTEVRRAKVNYVPRYTTVDGGLRNLIPWNRLVSSKNKVNMSNPYNVSDKSAYTGNMEGYRPIETRVTKTGLFGKPKKWTHIYSNAPEADPYKGNKLLIGDYPPPSEKDVKSKKDSKPEGWVDITGPDRGGMSDEEWDDTSFLAKMAMRKGDRKGARNEKRYNKQLQKDREFEAFGKGAYKVDLDAEKQKQLESDNKKLNSVFEAEGMGKADWWEKYAPKQNPNVINYNPEDDKPLPNGPGEITEEQLKLEADQQKAAEERLKLYNQNQIDENSYPAKMRDKSYNQFAKLRHFIPDESNVVTKDDYEDKIAQDDYENAMFEEYGENWRDHETDLERGNETDDETEVEGDNKRLGGGLSKAQTGVTVKSPTNGVNAGSDPTNPANEKEDLTKFTLDPDKVEAEADQEGFWDQAPPKETPEYNTIGIDNERKRFGNVNLEEAVNVGNAAILGGLGFLDRGKQAKQEADFMKTNTVSNAVYASSSDKDQGDYNENGSGAGMLRPNQTGNNTNGRFAFGQSGGYMQDGGQENGKSKEEILKDFTGKPEFKRGLDLMMQRDKTDNVDPFLDAMQEANYGDEDKAKYREAIGSMNDPEWLKIVPQKSEYTKANRHRELQELMNKVYGSQRYNTPYGDFAEGPRREDPKYYPTEERRPTPFDDGRVDPRTLEANQPSKPDENDPFATETFKKYQLGGYAEGGVVDMTEEELEEFLANGGEVEYLES